MLKTWLALVPCSLSSRRSELRWQEHQPLATVVAGFAPPEPCASSWASVLLAEVQTELASLAEAAKCAASRNYQTAPLARALHAEVVWELEQVRAAQARGCTVLDNVLLRKVSELRAGTTRALAMLQDALKSSNGMTTDAAAVCASKNTDDRHFKPETPPARSGVTSASAFRKPLLMPPSQPAGEAAVDSDDGSGVLGQTAFTAELPLGQHPSCPSQLSSRSPTSSAAAALGDVALNMRRVLDEIHLTRRGFAQEFSERHVPETSKDLRRMLFSSRERLKTCRGLIDRRRAISDGRSARS